MALALLAAAGCSHPADEPASETGARTSRAAEGDWTPGGGTKPSPEAPSVDNDPRTRQNDDGTVKIVGGTPVTTADYADTVGIARSGSSVVECTGTLIEPDVVLTAAHCACAGISGRAFVGNDAAVAGTFYAVKRLKHGLRRANSPTGPKCVKPMRLRDERDLAILLLDGPVQGVRPRPIAQDALVDRATSYRAVGFGATDRDATDYPDHKREAVITGTSNACTGSAGGASDQSVYGCKPLDEIVAGSLRDSTDTCNGDSGGPLLVSPEGTGRASRSDAFQLAGVTSRATSQSQSYCGDGGVYERLNAGAREWIRSTIAALRRAR